MSRQIPTKPLVSSCWNGLASFIDYRASAGAGILPYYLIELEEAGRQSGLGEQERQ